MTNGIGGYAGGSIIGACNRTHQGYLIASLHPPVERYLVFSKTNEKLDTGNPCLQSGNFPSMPGKDILPSARKDSVF